MRVLRNGEVFLATHIAGPSHNLLVLDFTPCRSDYVKDLAEANEPSISRSTVEEQVLRCLDESEVEPAELAGIQFDGTDTFSESVYYELAQAILEVRVNGTEVGTFSPRWSPLDFEQDEAE